MVLPILALVGATIASVAIPFFFPTKAETATVELNEKLGSGQFLLQPITTRDSDVNGEGFFADKKKLFLILIAIIIVILVVFRK